MDERGDDDNGEVQAKNVTSGSVVSADGRRITSRRRKPPDVFEPAFNIVSVERLDRGSKSKQRGVRNNECRNGEALKLAQFQPVESKLLEHEIWCGKKIVFAVANSLLIYYKTAHHKQLCFYILELSQISYK